MPWDLDENLHMNNSRYLQYMELGRWESMIRSGFLRYALKNKILSPIKNLTVTYRKELKVLTRFRVDTKILQWNDHSLVFEHVFFKGTEVCTVGLVECRILQKGNKANLSEIAKELGIHFSDNYKLETEVATKSSIVAKELLNIEQGSPRRV
jgi:YbgC/YbaW family acyl-CoA thioester hydrolase